MGNNNRSFFERFAEGMAKFIMFFLLMYFIIYIFSEIYDTIRFGRWDKILKWVLIFFCLWLFVKFIEHSDNIVPENKNEIEDTRSGQEIWNENMKDYDAERGY